MLVFIDDSGDAGFKFDKGSSRFFVISCVLFDDDLEAEKTAVAIKELKRTFKFPENVEFKFNKSRKTIRIKFLETINSFQFKVRSLVVDKSLIRSEELKHNKNSFYSYVIKLVLQHSDDTIIDAKVRIDGNGDRIFKKNFITYLRKQLNSSQKKIMKNCKLISSHSNVLIQMADMIAGTVRRSFEADKTDKDLYKKIVRKHIQDEWNFR